jgi:D-amino-acid dehydrogenase
MAFRAASRPELLVESARSMRPLFTQAVTEHETLLAEAGAGRYLRKNGWLKLYRTERALAALSGAQFALAQELGVPLRTSVPDRQSA